jgi:hypothetical protein
MCELNVLVLFFDQVFSFSYIKVSTVEVCKNVHRRNLTYLNKNYNTLSVYCYAANCFFYNYDY